MVGILVIVSIIVFILVDHLVLKFKGRQAWPWQTVSPKVHWPVLKALPQRFYSSSHAWFQMENDGTARVGLDPFILQALGVPTRVTIQEGQEKPVIVLESQGKIMRVEVPLAGKVVDQNQHLSAYPALLFGEADENWVLKVQPQSVGEAAAQSRVAERASQWLESEMRRFREFLQTGAGGRLETAQALADGGDPVPGILRELDESAWTSFENEFVNCQSRG